MRRKTGTFQFRIIAIMLFGLVIALVGTQSVQAKIYGDREKKIYHKEICTEVKDIKEGYLRLFDSEAEAESRGFYPCKKCIPPTGQPSLKNKEIKKLSLPIGREKKYVGDRKQKIYHNEWCPLIKDIPAKNRREFSSVKPAIQQDYLPCKECNPPVMFKRNKIKIDILEDEPDDELLPADVEASEDEALPEAEKE